MLYDVETRYSEDKINTEKPTDENCAEESFVPPVPGERRNGDDVPPPPPPPPPERSGYGTHRPSPMMLANEISKLFHDKIRIESEKANLPNSYRQILFHLAFCDGKTQLELAQLTHLKPPTVSVSLQKMESEGLVRRVPDENDLRQTRVYITENGRIANDMMRKKFREIEEAAVEGLDGDDMLRLEEILCKIRDNELRMLGCPPYCGKENRQKNTLDGKNQDE